MSHDEHSAAATEPSLDAGQGHSTANGPSGATPTPSQSDELMTMAAIVFTMIGQDLAIGHTVSANALVTYGYELLAELNSLNGEEDAAGESRVPAALLIAGTIAQCAASAENIRKPVALSLALRALAFIDDSPTHPVA